MVIFITLWEFKKYIIYSIFYPLMSIKYFFKKTVMLHMSTNKSSKLLLNKGPWFIASKLSHFWVCGGKGQGDWLVSVGDGGKASDSWYLYSHRVVPFDKKLCIVCFHSGIKGGIRGMAGCYGGLASHPWAISNILIIVSYQRNLDKLWLSRS